MMSNSKLLREKIALVTGASRGIGRCVAETFASFGATVLLNARTEGSLSDICSDIANQHQTQCHPLYFDVSNPDQTNAVFQEIFKAHRRLDILVNNAGILRDALFSMTPSATIHEVFETNTFGSMYCAQLASRLMVRQGFGSIVNISSIIGTHGNAGQVVYGASKAAIIGMTNSLAKEVATAGVRVNAVAPGFIDTDMIKAVPERKALEIRESIKMGRLGTAQDVANACLFFASDLSAYISGQTLGVDGCMLI